MTTILASYNSEGCTGRCDARCHMAKTEECNCICGGRYHGAGPDAQRMLTEDFFADPELRDRFAPWLVGPGGQLALLP